MSDRLPKLGVISYNGYELPYDVETLSYRITPAYDSSRRTVKWCDFSLTLRWYVTNEDTTGPTVQDMVAKLSRPGGELVYSGRGFGFDQPVNRGRVKDVDFGPRPTVAALTPMGGNKAVMVEWSVSFSIPTCSDAVFAAGSVAEWCYTVSDAVDAERVTTRTTSGHLAIANNRLTPGSKEGARNAGEFLEDVWPPLGEGFRLEGNSHEVSEDRSTLTYTQVVRETGPAPGLYVLTQSVEESMVTDAGNPYAHTRTIRGRYTLRPGRSPKEATDHFFALVEDRLARALKASPGVGLAFGGFDARTGDAHEARQKATLSFSFRVINARIAHALGSTGMWQPIPGSKHKLWYATVEDVLGPRGKANLIFDPKADKIVDLCKRSSAPTPQPQGSPQTQAELGNIPSNLFPDPTPDNSWWKYDVALRTVIDAGNVVVKTLPEEPLQQVELRNGGFDFGPRGSDAELVSGPGPDARGGSGRFGDKGGRLKPDPLADFVLPRVVKGGSREEAFGGDDTVIQQRTTPTVYVNVTGRAVRHGYPIPHPDVRSIDGNPAYLITRGTSGEGFVTGVVGQNVYPVFGARFSLWYVVPGLSKAVAPGQPVPGR